MRSYELAIWQESNFSAEASDKKKKLLLSLFNLNAVAYHKKLQF